MQSGQTPLWIVGYRDFGFDVAEAAEQAGFSVSGYIDYDPGESRDERHEANAISIDHLSPDFERHFVCAMTSTVLRRKLVGRIAELTDSRLQPATLIHPRAAVSPSAEIESGSIVMANAVVAASAGLGIFNLVNRGATIGHHTRLGAYCTIGPGVNIGGNCRLGDNVYVGIGATVLNKIRIGSSSLIGAGAVVAKDVPERTVVMGVPARVVQSDFAGR